MLGEIFAELDEWIVAENLAAAKDGHRAYKPCTFRIVGQAALLEADIDIDIAATADIDAITDAEFEIFDKLNKFLQREGMELDQLSNEIWMPDETEYEDLFNGHYVRALLAKPAYVILSKAKMAMAKNKYLIQQYLASEPPKAFFKLAKKYNVNLEKVFEDTE